MKTPTDAAGQPGATAALLNSGVDFVFADLWTLTLNGGGVVRWSGAQIALTFNGDTWALGPVIDRGKITTKRGTEVSTVDMTLMAGPGDLINGTPLLAFIRASGFDGARVRLDRAYMTAWGAPIVGTINKFQGRVTSIKNISRTEATVTISSDLVLLNVGASTDYFQAPCLNSLYDVSCTVSKPAFTTTGAVVGAASTTGFSTSLTAPDAYYTQGQITFTAGANAGISRTIKSYANAAGQIQLVLPLPAAAAAGDAFTIAAGCDLTMATCQARFNNLIHFRGQPFTPPPETIYG
jgi:uncharacterized phage protein (TIGR02218 family)